MLRGLIVAGLLSPAAFAQSNLFRMQWHGPQLTAADYDQLYASVAKLNASATPGQVETWQNAQSKASGTSTLAAVQGSCHTIRHHVVSPRMPQGYDATLTWCRAPDGRWKVK